MKDRTHFESLIGYPFANKALCGAVGDIKVVRYPKSDGREITCKECLKLMKKIASEEYEI